MKEELRIKSQKGEFHSAKDQSSGAGIFLTFKSHWQTRKTLCLQPKGMPLTRRTSVEAVLVRSARADPDRCARSQGLFIYPLSSYRLVGAGLYPAWIASCSVMYLPFRVVP